MQIGWDSKTDTFFINGLTDAEAGAVQGIIADLLPLIREKKIRLFPISSLLGEEGCEKFLYEFQHGLFKAKQIKTQIQKGKL